MEYRNSWSCYKGWKASDKCYTQQKGIVPLQRALTIYHVNCSTHTYLFVTCLNQRVVTLHGCRQTGETVVRGLLCPVHFTTTLHWQFQNICEKILQMHFKVAVRNFYVFIVQAGDSLTDALRVVIVLWLKDELGSCPLGCFMQLVFNTKANLTGNHCLSNLSATRVTTHRSQIGMSTIVNMTVKALCKGTMPFCCV